ncbi:hypothetical protein MRX96_033464 [Rhipicephalus microplus]
MIPQRGNRRQTIWENSRRVDVGNATKRRSREVRVIEGGTVVLRRLLCDGIEEEKRCVEKERWNVRVACFRRWLVVWAFFSMMNGSPLAPFKGKAG